MFGMERLQTIKEILLDKKSVDVSGLSKLLSVSEVTIRRDLDKLEKEGFIVKTYGGAVLKEAHQQELLNIENRAVKKEYIEIAETAEAMVQDNDVIFLAGDDICLSISEQLKNKKGIVVVTNSLLVATNLYEQKNLRVILTGGDVEVSTGKLVGNDVFHVLQNILLQKAFISVQGIDIDLGYTVNSQDDVEIYKVLKKITKQIIVVADIDKFGKIGLKKLDDLEQVDSVITNKNIPDVFKQYYYDHNVRVYTPYKF
jgi:DeoR/GlpR family transcriptional regulator of sugar metabolism